MDIISLKSDIFPSKKSSTNIKADPTRKDYTNDEGTKKKGRVKGAACGCETLFTAYRGKDGLYNVAEILSALELAGLRRSDQRLEPLFDGLKKLRKERNEVDGAAETQRLDRETFLKLVRPNYMLIHRALTGRLIIPDFPGFCAKITELYNQCKDTTDGLKASYIPQLMMADDNYWGLSICTIDGQRFSIGDATTKFTIQSCAKPVTYALALEKMGHDRVHEYVGKEPSGRGFNELILNYCGMPHNPMINSGAIIICALLNTLVEPQMTQKEKSDYLLDFFSRMAGNEELGFNGDVCESEMSVANRNYALAYLMKESCQKKRGCFPQNANFQDCMRLYFEACSFELNCEQQAVIAATLAHGGVCPTNCTRVLKSTSVRDVLSLMRSCGMYDYSGEFAFEVGLPAKSGVSGNMMIVVPNTMGISLYSPPLDSLGNSCRGLEFCRLFINTYNFHHYDDQLNRESKPDPRLHISENQNTKISDLLFSAARGDLEHVRLLWVYGMDMNLPDYDGRTALHLAAAGGHVDVVTFLLHEVKVKVDVLDRWGHRPIDDARQFGKEDVVQVLEEWNQRGGQKSEL